jgi:integrase
MLSTALALVRAELAAEGFARHALVYPYQLRHTWACESLEAGALIHDVAAQLGHAKVSTTLDVYGPGRGDAARVARIRASLWLG